MNEYEQMMKFQIGIEMGLLSVEELKSFLSDALRQKDVPYIYTDVFLSLPKGEDTVTEAIFYNLHSNFSVDRSPGNTVQRLLIGEIKRKYKSCEIDLDRCVALLHKLTEYSECGWELLSVEEYYELFKSGFQGEQEFMQKLDKIFAMAE